MKWIIAFIALCFFVVPAIGATLDGTEPEHSFDSDQVLVVFDDLLDRLNEIAGTHAQLDDDRLTRLTDIFFQENFKRQNELPFTLELMYYAAIDIPADEPGLSGCYGCAPIYIVDSIVTLFYFASSIEHANSMNFAANLHYLKFLVAELQSYGIGAHCYIDAGYIAALENALEGWEDMQDSPYDNAQALAVFEALVDDLSVLARIDDISSDSLSTRLGKVFSVRGDGGQSTTFIVGLYADALHNSKNTKCPECSSLFVLDSIATLFYLAGITQNYDQELASSHLDFIYNLHYLTYLVSEMKKSGGVDYEYIGALQTATDGWGKVYGVQPFVRNYIPERHMGSSDKPELLKYLQTH